MPIIEASYIDRLHPEDSKHKRKTFISKSGTGMVPVYEYKVIDGIKQLVNSGERNVQEEIDSFALSTDIHVLIERFVNGDTSVMRPDGVFGDFTNAPTTYAEMFEGVQKCKNLFDSLPSEIRDKFDNSYEKFWSEYGTDYFDDVFKSFNSDKVDAPVSEPKKDEVVNNAE